jgi:PDZ domain-containing protein
VAAVLFIALIVVGLTVSVPYITFSPGPTTNTLGDVDGDKLITITGHPTYPASGQLLLTTVAESEKLDLLVAVKDWFSASNAVVPQELVRPPGKSQEEVQQQTTQQMTDSQESATVAAMAALGIKSTGTQVVVEAVEGGSPADGVLENGDVFVSIGGQPVTAPDQVSALVQAAPAGEKLPMVVGRRGKVQRLTVIPRQVNGKNVVGISVAQTPKYPVKVSIDLQNVGGPSAGLMFSLGIYDLLTPGSLTGGQIFAGTGTIADDGTVGAIGGIQQKIRGALSDGAKYFFVPADNCKEAKGNKPDGITLLKVNSLKDALGDLRGAKAGRTDLAGC